MVVVLLRCFYLLFPAACLFFRWQVAGTSGACMPLLLACCAKRRRAAAASHKRPVLRYNYAVKTPSANEEPHEFE